MELLNKITLDRINFRKGIEVAGKFTGVRTVKDRMINIFIFKEHVFVFTNEGVVPYTFFHKQDALEFENVEISLQVNPQELINAFKGSKGDLIEVSLYKNNNGKGVLELNNSNVECILLKERNFKGKGRSFILADSEKEIVDTIKYLGDSISEDVESVEVGGRFLKLKSPNFMKSTPLNIDIPRVIVDPSGFADMAKQITLTKSANNLVYMFADNNELAVRVSHSFDKMEKNFEQLYILNSIRNESQKMNEFETKTVFTFSIDATKMNGILKKYKKEHSHFFLSSEGNTLKIDPYGSKEAMENMKMKQTDEFFKKEKKKKNPKTEYNWESEVETIPLFKHIDASGKPDDLARTKVLAESLKVLFKGYSGELEVDVLEYVYENREFYKFRCYKEGLESICMLIKEPNYRRIQKKLDDIIEFQKKLSYI